jgi:hypothetical protein
VAGLLLVPRVREAKPAARHIPAVPGVAPAWVAAVQPGVVAVAEPVVGAEVAVVEDDNF